MSEDEKWQQLAAEMLRMVAELTGIPASTLSALRAGTHVVVPENALNRILHEYAELRRELGLHPDFVIVPRSLLAASEVPGHD